MKSNNGFILLDRSLLEWQYADNVKMLGFWTYLLLEANWKDGYFKGDKIPRGSFATSIRGLSKKFGISNNTVIAWLTALQNAHQLIRESRHSYTLISIVNYDKYQDFKNRTDTPTASPTASPTAHNRTKQQGNKGKKNDDDIYTRARKLLDLERQRNIDAYQGNQNVEKAFDKLERIIKTVPMTESVLNNMDKAIAIACHYWIENEHDGIVYPVAYIKSVLTGENDDI